MVPDLGLNFDLDFPKAKAKAKGPAEERLAHRGCNTRKGAVAPVVPWPTELFVADPAPLFETADALLRKGGRIVVGRCLTKGDANDATAWLIDRFSRLAPALKLSAAVEPGGGQFLLVLQG